MKTKLAVLLVIGMKLGCLIGLAQDNPAARTDEISRAALSASPQLAQAQAAQNPAAAPAEAAAESGEVLPLVVFEDALLTDAIKTLARQANINIVFDPRVTAGPVGPDGKPAPLPNISVRFENVTAEAALEAVLANHNLILMKDPKTKIARVTIKDPTALEPLVTKVIQLTYSNPTNMAVIIKGALPSPSRSQVLADTRTAQLVVLATEKEMEAVEDLVKELDTPIKQVLIEARLLETSRSPSTIKGIDWSGTLAAQNLTFGNGLTSSRTTVASPGDTTAVTLPSGRVVSRTEGSKQETITQSVLDPLSNVVGIGLNTARGFHPSTAFLNADGVRAVLSFLNTDADTELLATPRAVTLDNETATLAVTRAFPIFEVTPGAANVPAGAQITYTNLGTILRVTPRIAADDNISLKVVPEVSNIESKDRQIINGLVNEANVYAIRKIETQVLIPSGHTLVMGGLINDNISKTYTKVPVLGDLPVLGLAFRRSGKTRTKSNLLIFITPTIVQENDFQPTITGFLQTPVVKDRPDIEPSAWDSGKPHDWTKPVY